MISLEQFIALFPNFLKNIKRNFITPIIIGYTVTDEFIIELSSGLGIKDLPIYGVTVFDKNTFENTNLSKPFFNYRDAANYIASLC